MTKLSEITEQITDFFWGIGYFGPQIAIFYTLFITLQISIVYGVSYLVFYILSLWLNHNVLKKVIYDLRPKNYILYLQTEKARKVDNGMPSGHTQATAFCLTIAYLITNKYLYQSIALLLITFLQRYMFRNHTFNQLLVGTILGVILGYVSYYVMNLLEKRIKRIEKRS
jgi:membrane-associated phospholipid phosphatase